MNHLRPATAWDIPAIAETFVSAVNFSIPGRRLGDEFYDLAVDLAPGEPGVPPGKLRTRIQEQLVKEQLWLAEIDGKVAGYISWYAPTRTEESYKPGEITYLFVHPSFHGRGVGTTLLSHVKQQLLDGAKDIGVVDSETLLEVRCFTKNLHGLRLYEDRGFVRKQGAEEWHERVHEYLTLLLWSQG